MSSDDGRAWKWLFGGHSCVEAGLRETDVTTEPRAIVGTKSAIPTSHATVRASLATVSLPCWRQVTSRLEIHSDVQALSSGFRPSLKGPSSVSAQRAITEEDCRALVTGSGIHGSSFMKTAAFTAWASGIPEGGITPKSRLAEAKRGLFFGEASRKRFHLTRIPVQFGHQTAYRRSNSLLWNCGTDARTFRQVHSRQRRCRACLGSVQ